MSAELAPLRLPQTGTAFAGGGQLAFLEEASMTDCDRWGDKRKIDGIIDLLTIKEVRQIELDVIVAEVSLLKLRDIGFDFSAADCRNATPITFLGSQSGFGTTYSLRPAACLRHFPVCQRFLFSHYLVPHAAEQRCHGDTCSA